MSETRSLTSSVSFRGRHVISGPLYARADDFEDSGHLGAADENSSTLRCWAGSSLPLERSPEPPQAPQGPEMKEHCSVAPAGEAESNTRFRMMIRDRRSIQ